MFLLKGHLWGKECSKFLLRKRVCDLLFKTCFLFCFYFNMESSKIENSLTKLNCQLSCQRTMQIDIFYSKIASFNLNLWVLK